MRFQGWILIGIWSVCAHATIEKWHCEKNYAENNTVIAADLTLDTETLNMELDKLSDLRMKIRGSASEITLEDGKQIFVLSSSEYPIKLTPSFVKTKTGIPTLQFVTGATPLLCHPR